MIPMPSVGCAQYTVSVSIGELPAIYPRLLEHAAVHDDFGVREADGTSLVVAVQTAAARWPELVISQRFSPGPEGGFQSGVFVIPENDLLLLGAGRRLLAYDLRNIRRLWKDEADTGFWGWKRHDDFILMSAELELAAWDLQGRKMWSTFVEPPWDYEVHGERVELDVMGMKSIFPVRTGPLPRAGQRG
jgi:hypothetical protein